MVSSLLTLSVLYPHLPTLALASSSHSQQQWWEIPLKLNQMALLLTKTYWIDVYFSGLFNIWEIFYQSVFNITGEKRACTFGLLWFIWVILKCFFIPSFISRAGYRVWLFKILLYNCNNEHIYVHAHYLLYYHMNSFFTLFIYLATWFFWQSIVAVTVATLIITFYTSSFL